MVAPLDPCRQGLIDRLAMSVDDNGVGMTDQELRDEIMTLMVAGQETSAILLTWVCALLAWHPDIQVGASLPSLPTCCVCCPALPPSPTRGGSCRSSDSWGAHAAAVAQEKARWEVEGVLGGEAPQPSR